MINLDLTVKLGDLLQVGAIFGGGVVFLWKMRGDAAVVRSETKAEAKKSAERLDALEDEMKKQTDILVRLAAGEERMNGFDHRITVLENTHRGQAA